MKGKIDEIKVSCGICKFPKYLKEAPNSQFGKIVFWKGVSIESLKEHFLKEHTKEYKDLLKEIKPLTESKEAGR